MGARALKPYSVVRGQGVGPGGVGDRRFLILEEGPGPRE